MATNKFIYKKTATSCAVFFYMYAAKYNKECHAHITTTHIMHKIMPNMQAAHSSDIEIYSPNVYISGLKINKTISPVI